MSDDLHTECRVKLYVAVALTLVLVTCAVILTGCGAREGVSAQLAPLPTVTSRWYDATMSAAMSAVQTPCPSTTPGCFAHPPQCVQDLCYCPRVCEPNGWERAPGLTPDGVWAGQQFACSCKTATPSPSVSP